MTYRQILQVLVNHILHLFNLKLMTKMAAKAMETLTNNCVTKLQLGANFGKRVGPN